MVSLLKWIWSAVKTVGKGVLQVWAAIWNVLSSLVTWIVGVIIYAVDTLWDWASDRITDFFDDVSSLLSDSPWNVSAGSFDMSPLAEHLCNVFALDVAIECLLYLLAAFVMVRMLRLAMIPARAVLEVL